MIGFDKYDPSKWLEGILVVHVAAPKAVVESIVRGGRWVARGAVATVFAAGFVASAVAAQPSSEGSAVVTLWPGTPLEDALPEGDVPSGYYSAILQAVPVLPRLPEQSRAQDPEFMF